MEFNVSNYHLHIFSAVVIFSHLCSFPFALSSFLPCFPLCAYVVCLVHVFSLYIPILIFLSCAYIGVSRLKVVFRHLCVCVFFWPSFLREDFFVYSLYMLYPAVFLFFHFLLEFLCMLCSYYLLRISTCATVIFCVVVSAAIYFDLI